MSIKNLTTILIIIFSIGCVFSIATGGSVFFNLVVLVPAISMLTILYIAVDIGLKKCDERIKKTENLLKENSQNAEACYDLAVLYALRDIRPIDRQRGIEQFEYFVKNFPNHPLREDAERAIMRLKSKLIIFYYLSGKHGIRLSSDVYLLQGKIKDAITIHKQNLEINPEDGHALFGMATALSRLGNYEEAIEYLKKFQSLAQKEGVMDLEFGTWKRQKIGNIFQQNIEKAIKKLERHQHIGSFEEEFAMSSEEKNRIKRTLKILLVGALLIGIALVLMRIVVK